MGYILFPDLWNLWSENCGIAILPPGWVHKRRKIDTSVIILGYQGSVRITDENQQYTITPSKLCVLSENRQHWGTEEIKEKARYYWIHIKSKTIPRMIPENEARTIFEHPEVARTRLSNSLLFPCEFTLKNANTIREMFHEILYEQQNPGFTYNKYQSMVRLMLITLNETILKSFRDDRKLETNSLVNTIIEKIYDNLTNRNFSVKSLAGEIGYNPDYLNRHFKSITQKSLVEFLIDKRIELSLVKLIDEMDSIDSISRKCGFSSYRNYIHQFKLRKDIPPSQYRNRLRMMHITNK